MVQVKYTTTITDIILSLSLSLSSTASDYIPVTEMLVFSTNTTRRCFNVTSLDDTILEGLQSYRLELSFTQNLNTSFCYDNSNVTIIDHRSKSAYVHIFT